VHGISPARFAADFDLPPGDRVIAQNADALVVERMPFPPQIDRLQDREFFFWQKFGIHLGAPESNPTGSNSEIGSRADAHIGQTPSVTRSFCAASDSKRALIGIYLSDQ